MKFQFETSLGMCYGSNKDGDITFEEETRVILQSLYDRSFYDKVEGKWLKIGLADDYYGSPEYKIVYID